MGKFSVPPLPILLLVACVGCSQPGSTAGPSASRFRRHPGRLDVAIDVAIGRAGERRAGERRAGEPQRIRADIRATLGSGGQGRVPRGRRHEALG